MVTNLFSAKRDLLISGKEVNIYFLHDILYLHWSFVGEEPGFTAKACTVIEIWVQHLSSDALKQLQDTEWMQKETSKGH